MLVHTLCAPAAQSSVGVALRWRAWRSCSAQFVVLAMLSIPVVHCMHANLRYRRSTFLVFRTSPLPQRATVATHLRQASPLVSGPSATRRALGQSWWGSLWWLPPIPGRGRGTGWVIPQVGAQRGPSVFLRKTIPTVAMPAPSGVAMTGRCRRTCSRLVVIRV